MIGATGPVAWDPYQGGRMDHQPTHRAHHGWYAQSPEKRGCEQRVALVVVLALLLMLPARSVAQDTTTFHNLGMFFPDQRGKDPGTCRSGS